MASLRRRPAGLGIRIDGFDEIGDMVNPRQYRQALKAAIDKTARAVRKEGANKVREEYAIRARAIGKRTYVARPSIRNLIGAAWFGSRVFASLHFPVSRPGARRPWVRVRKGQRERYADSFSYEKHGARFLWQRSDFARPRNPRYDQGLIDPVRDQKITLANVLRAHLPELRRFRDQVFNRTLEEQLRRRARRSR